MRRWWGIFHCYVWSWRVVVTGALITGMSWIMNGLSTFSNQQLIVIACDCIISGWLVVYLPLLKNMSKSVGMMTFPAECKVKKFHGSKPPTSWGLYQIHLFRLHLPPFSPRLRRVHRQRWGTSCPHFAKKGHGGSLRPSPLRYPPHPQSVDCPKSVFVALSWRWLVTSTVANPWPLVDHVGGSRSA